jgi:hypothetical protein
LRVTGPDGYVFDSGELEYWQMPGDGPHESLANDLKHHCEQAVHFFKHPRNWGGHTWRPKGWTGY